MRRFGCCKALPTGILGESDFGWHCSICCFSSSLGLLESTMSCSDLWPLLADLLAAEDELAFHQLAVTRFLESGSQGEGDCRGVAIVRSQPPHWELLAAAGAETVPVELAAEALDAMQPKRQNDWLAVPLQPPVEPLQREPPTPFPPTALLVCTSASDADWVSVAAGLAAGSLIARHWHRTERHARRLATLLEITHQWAQTDNLETLLNRMAEEATELFEADRATIFLWDRAEKILVGRPALGMENNELRVPDNAGVVGRVVQSGKPERVDHTDSRAVIHGAVDAETGYSTETILCVPLVEPSGKRLGAFELLNKRAGNFTTEDEAGLQELASYAGVALANTQHWQELLERQQQLVDQAAGSVQMVGDCPPIEALRSTVAKVADTDLAILILGQNGTGKEVVAQSLHYQSHRRLEPFVAVNCAAIAESLLESELFGHEKGAFTDARETRAGKFELATGGTLFLDEIGDMSLGGQAKLLRVLEEKTVVRVGGSEPIATDVRVVAATNQNLASLVREKKFREDLYFRLNVVCLELPPLCERGDDILTLANFFLRSLCQKQGRKMPTMTASAKKRLVAHRWPGNVRELRNLMERLAYLTTGDKIDADDLAFTLSPNASASSASPAFELGHPLQEATREFQVEYIEQTIQQVRGNVTEAAKLLGVHRSNLYRKMRSLGMEPEEE